MSTAVLTVQILLSGDALAAAQASGSLLVGASQFQGNAIAESAASATLTTQIPLSAAALAQADATGTLSVSILLAGHAAVRATALAALTTPSAAGIPLRLWSRTGRARYLTSRISKRGRLVTRVSHG
jgi:hypothetical protein